MPSCIVYLSSIMSEKTRPEVSRAPAERYRLLLSMRKGRTISLSDAINDAVRRAIESVTAEDGNVGGLRDIGRRDQEWVFMGGYVDVKGEPSQPAAKFLVRGPPTPAPGADIEALEVMNLLLFGGKPG